jgi:hypothetical protein
MYTTPVLLEKFLNLVEDQFKYGGKKYQLQGVSTRESTDVLFDTHGMTWLFGTCHKYCFRYSNLQRERDLFKIATYMFLTWLKRGYFCKAGGTTEPLDTSLTIKELFFPVFKTKVVEANESFSFKGTAPIEVIGNLMSTWSDGTWSDVNEDKILTVFLLAYTAWEKDFGINGGKDLDTWNENGNK